MRNHTAITNAISQTTQKPIKKNGISGILDFLLTFFVIKKGINIKVAIQKVKINIIVVKKIPTIEFMKNR